MSPRTKLPPECVAPLARVLDWAAADCAGVEHPPVRPESGAIITCERIREDVALLRARLLELRA